MDELPLLRIWVAEHLGAYIDLAFHVKRRTPVVAPPQV